MSNPINGRRVAFPDAYPGRQFNVVDGEAGIYVETTGGRMQINHDATPWHYLDNWKWFINECGEPYDYDPEHQAEHFPNDDHTPYDTEEEAQAAADAAETERAADETWDCEEPDEIEEIVGHIRRKDGTVAAFRIAQFPSDTGYGYVQWGTPAIGRNVSLLETITTQLNGGFE